MAILLTLSVPEHSAVFTTQLYYAALFIILQLHLPVITTPFIRLLLLLPLLMLLLPLLMLLLLMLLLMLLMMMLLLLMLRLLMLLLLLLLLMLLLLMV